MQMDPGYLAVLRERYGYAEWSDVANAAPVVAQGIDTFKGSELPGWTLRRGTRSTPSDGVTLVRGIWSAANASNSADDRAIDVEVFFCRSAAAARELLLSVLGDMQGPVAVRMAAGAVGDVAFHIGGDIAIMFARGNVVVRVRNAGRSVASVAREAAAVDALVVRGLPGKG